MQRREFIKRTGAGLGLLALPSVAGAMASTGHQENDKPNIIFVLADDQTPAYLSCYGGRTPTPNLDRLAREGALFTGAHAASTLCGPSRYNILTGEFAGRNERMCEFTPDGEAVVIYQDARLTPDDPSIGELLADEGYFTGFVGKWHSNFEVPALTGKPTPKTPADPTAPGADEQLHRNQEVYAELIRKAARFEYVSHVVYGNNLGKWPITHNPEWLTEGAIEFIKKAREDGRPFFLHLANTIPHAPSVCLALETDVRYTLGGKLDKRPESHPPRSTIPERLKAAGLPVSSEQVGAVMLDDQVGALLKTLKRLGLDDNTVLVFAQDHGIFGKGSCYSSGSHSALLMRWPHGIEPGTVVHDHVSFVDFVPTFLDMAGVRNPSGYGSDGISFLPALHGKPLTRSAIYCELGVVRSVIKGRYHYIAFRPTPSQIAEMKNGEVKVALDTWGRVRRSDNNYLIPYKPHFFEPDQLYDLATDPLERNNLAGYPGYEETLADMKEELKKYLDSMPTPFPLEIDPFVQSEHYKELVEARRKFSSRGNYWPGYPELDWEAYTNFNLKTPEEVDPTHPSSWQPGKAAGHHH